MIAGEGTRDPDRARGSGRVFLVRHRHRHVEGHLDDKMIGVFASTAAAERAIDGLREQPGFRDAREGFTVHPLPVGKMLAHGIELIE